MDENIVAAAVEAVKNTKIKKHWYSNFPRWLKAVLLVISIVTLAYWVFYLIYKILWSIQKIGAFIFNEKCYWICIASCVVGSIVAIVVCEACGLNIVGQIEQWFIDQYLLIEEEVITFIKELIS